MTRKQQMITETKQKHEEAVYRRSEVSHHLNFALGYIIQSNSLEQITIARDIDNLFKRLKEVWEIEDEMYVSELEVLKDLEE